MEELLSFLWWITVWIALWLILTAATYYDTLNNYCTHYNYWEYNSDLHWCIKDNKIISVPFK